jgi:hypothetical protein
LATASSATRTRERTRPSTFTLREWRLVLLSLICNAHDTGNSAEFASLSRELSELGVEIHFHRDMVPTGGAAT